MSNNLIALILERLSQENIDTKWYSGKTILVTGGAGFIGSWLVEALMRLEANVYVVDNLWRGSLNNLKSHNGDYFIDMNRKFLMGDLREFHTALSSCLWSKPDIVFHLADVVAGIDFVFSNEPFLYRANLLINSNMVTAVKKAGVKRYVYVGTACSYPKKIQMEKKRSPLLENQAYPADPESSYGWSKLMGEYESELMRQYFDLDLGILRLHNVYGPRSLLSVKRSQVIPSLIRKAILHPHEDFVVWGSGNQARDFVFVGDVVDALLRLPLKGMNKGVIQIGTAKETTISELAEEIVKISGKEINIKFDRSKPEGDSGRSGNFGKAKSLLNWKAFTSLKEGLKQTYSWAFDQIRNEKVHLND